jgi:hypothetical protein
MLPTVPEQTLGILTTGLLGAIGLCFDIIGAFFLSKALVFKRPKEVRLETNSYFDGNPFALRSIAQQRIDARAGFVFLLLGFGGQFIAYTTWITSGPDQHPRLGHRYLRCGRCAGVVLCACFITAVEPQEDRPGVGI